MIRTTGKWLNHNSTQHKQNIAKDKFHSLKFRFFGSCFTFISHTYSSRLYDKQLLTASSAIHRSRSFAIFSYQNVCKGTHIFAWDGFRSFKICVCVCMGKIYYFKVFVCFCEYIKKLFRFLFKHFNSEMFSRYFFFLLKQGKSHIGKESVQIWFNEIRSEKCSSRNSIKR